MLFGYQKPNISKLIKWNYGWKMVFRGDESVVVMNVLANR